MVWLNRTARNVNKISSLKLKWVAFIFLFGFATACSSSDFAGSAAEKKSENGKDAPAKQGKKGEGGADDPDLLNNAGGGGKNGKIGSEDDVIQSKVIPQFAMMARDFECTACHMQIRGDVVSLGKVSNWSSMHFTNEPGRELVKGKWYVQQSFSLKTYDGKSDYPVKVEKGVVENYNGSLMPKAFPVIDFAAIRTIVVGKAEAPANNQSVTNVHKGNLVLLGTVAQPIKLQGEVLVEGDLVIKGFYEGVGTIYVTGNIYIPFDLRAKRSAFPFPENDDDALKKAKEIVANKGADALGLAAGKSVMIAELETMLYPTMDQAVNVAKWPADFIATLAGKMRPDLEVESVYGWYPGGKAEYTKLYESSYNCLNGASVPHGFNLVEAYIYARKTIGGLARSNSWAINGGIIADSVHILGRGGWHVNSQPCPSKAHPVHGYVMNRNYINFDFRMKTGLEIMGQLAPFFGSISE